MKDRHGSNFAPEQSAYYGKLAYDLAAYDSIAYAACFYGGLIRSTDWGTTWTNLYPSQLDTIKCRLGRLCRQDIQ